MQSGEVLGWSWLLPPYRWHSSARALEPTEAIALDGKALRTKCEEDHDLGYEVMKRFALVIVQRLVATRARSLNFPDPGPAPEVPDPAAFRSRGSRQERTMVRRLRSITSLQRNPSAGRNRPAD